MHNILIGTTILASFLGGAVALFAPCCISVMLPAYFATSFARKRALVAMTFVFALGVGAVILPIAFGASGLSHLISGHHTAVFLGGGVLLVGLGLATLAGWKPSLPMLGMRARTDSGPASVFFLGVFSGVASACCAPVLAGVVALSGATASFVGALVVGVAYVFGMVLPLFLIALAWDRYDWGDSRLLRGRTFALSVFGRERQVHSTSLLSGVLLMAMGALVVVLAFTGTAMPTRGWQVDLSARLQHYAKVMLSWLGVVPGWVSALVIFAALGLLLRKAVAQYLDAQARGPEADEDVRNDDERANDDQAPSTDALAAVSSKGDRA